MTLASRARRPRCSRSSACVRRQRCRRSSPSCRIRTSRCAWPCWRRSIDCVRTAARRRSTRSMRWATPRRGDPRGTRSGLERWPFGGASVCASRNARNPRGGSDRATSGGIFASLGGAMAERVMQLESQSSELSPDEVELTGVDGVETLSGLYRYSLRFVTIGEMGLSPEAQQDILRNPCRVRFGTTDDEHEVFGVLANLRMHSVSVARDIRFSAELVPRLWRATLTRRSRVFQDLDVPGILRAVLTEHGLEEGAGFEMRLDASYPVSEYTVQYQESDFDFISRLMEHHGIFYFFRQNPDGELMVIGDANRAFDKIADEPIEYARDGAPPGMAAGVHRLERVVQPRPAGVVLRDYNWRTPDVQLQVDAPVDQVTGVGFVNAYGDHFKTAGEGSALAQVRAEELLVDQERYELRTSIPQLAPGHRLELASHPLGEMDQEYVVTRVRRSTGQNEEGREDGAEWQEVEAIPHRVAFRPARVTERPRILGLMHGHVDGEVPGTAAPIDELGRYKILLPFDLVGQPGGKASRWVRLAQPASGAGFGIHFPLHIGVEVVVSHLDGDPDRPVIVASPPNTKTITPVTSNNATQSKIRTQTGIRITFDDDVV
ncbi:MAG: type VI secretion system tip protein VgrG [Sandaracinaceae bacterium]|nr:MAG: type VI secretion system tip protein VgrG [Sandaracinaceae bacterium]